jgi:hypothetical protein
MPHRAAARLNDGAGPGAYRTASAAS